MLDSAFGVHRAVDPAGVLPQMASRLDNDFTRPRDDELLIDVETLNLDAASFRQMWEEAKGSPEGVAEIVLRTVRERGKQHNPVTGSGGMLLGRVAHVGHHVETRFPFPHGARIATLVSLTLTPLRLDEVLEVRPQSAQIDVRGQAVLFASGAAAPLPSNPPERVVLAALDVCGAPALTVRALSSGDSALILGAGGKSGVLCCVAARHKVGAHGRVIGVESNERYAEELRGLGVCDTVLALDATDPLAVRRAVLDETAGREVDLSLSCVNVEGAEMSAVLCTRPRGRVVYFAMSTSFTRAALGAEGLGRDVEMWIGNGYAEGHVELTLELLRAHPELQRLFASRYG